MEWIPCNHRQTGPGARVVREGILACAYCRGSGIIPGTAASKCPICRGEGTIFTQGPVVDCPFCRGRGTSKAATRVTCLVCKGTGALPAAGLDDICPTCRGSATEAGGKLPCRTCRGRGVVAARAEAAESVPSASKRGRTKPLPTEHAGLERRLRERERTHEEFTRRRRDGKMFGPPAPRKATPLVATKARAATRGEPQELGIVEWLGKGLAQWADENQRQDERQVRTPNGAALAVMLRKAVAAEKALALGRSRAGPRASALEREAAEWKRREEEKEKRLCRETAMLEHLIRLMIRDRVFDITGEERMWAVGEVNCLAEKAPQDGWSLVVTNLHRSRFVLRSGWGDLLGIYKAQLDDQLNLTHFLRVTPEELEESAGVS